ncbi:MAG: glycosyltransferase family 9 protein [Anaerolineaceae bacterium]|nr:glycosyltransferase family 9 protein [Anaerolineaceae bacterium]
MPVIAVPSPRGKEEIRRGLVIDPAAEHDFTMQMQAEQFDLALQLQDAGEYSNSFLRAFAPRYLVGLKSANAAPLDHWIPYLHYQNEVVRALEVVGLAGASLSSDRLLPHLNLLDKDYSDAAPIVEQLHRPFAVLHPGSTDPRRCWSPQKFAEVGDFLAASGFSILLTGTSIESGRVNAVAEAMRAPVINLCGRLGLLGLAGLLAQAALFVGNDTGPLHLALAVGAKAVGLFWAEYIVNSLPLTRVTFYPLIAWQRTCPGCGAFLIKKEIDHPSGSCAHGYSMLEEIGSADVIRGVKALIASAR